MGGHHRSLNVWNIQSLDSLQLVVEEGIGSTNAKKIYNMYIYIIYGGYIYISIMYVGGQSNPWY
jgi:hypothetical protein